MATDVMHFEEVWLLEDSNAVAELSPQIITCSKGLQKPAACSRHDEIHTQYVLIESQSQQPGTRTPLFLLSSCTQVCEDGCSHFLSHLVLQP
jgi:hypothetical protein